jgi:tetratricopeptide (TPR) repeat protein
MAWRRLSMWYANTGQLENAQEAAVRAYRHSDRLSDVERHLTVATYYSNGPEVDEEKALAAYQSALERDSLNTVALNNASLILARRREWQKAVEYRLRGAAQPGATPQNFSNALSAAASLGRWELSDSLQREFVRRFPTNPVAQYAPARAAAARGEFDRAEQLEKEVLPRLQGSQTAMINHLGFAAELALVRGKFGEALRARTEQRERQSRGGGAANARLSIGFDSVLAAALVLEDPVRARAVLDRAVRRAPVDSIPYLERNYDLFLAVAALAGDTIQARQWYKDHRESWKRFGRTVDRPAWESYGDAMLAIAEGRHDQALASLREADQRNHPRLDLLHSMRFVASNRMQQADSAISAGEAYLAITQSGRLSQDALFLAGIRQRLGEMYEAKGNLDKALEHYTAFVELWKEADAELQPRVRDVRGRIERLQRRRG